MVHGTLIYDQLLKNYKSFYRTYLSSHFVFKLNVISGSIQIRIKNQQQNKTIFEKIYNASGE